MSSLKAKQSVINRLWYQTKTKFKPFFRSGATKASIVGPSPIGGLPQEIVEEILSYFIYELRNLIACSLTCRSWYIATVSHLHYSLTTDDHPPALRDKNCQWPGPLEKMYEFDLLQLVKRLRIRLMSIKGRFTREELGGRNLCYFSALKNLQELGIDNLQVSSFIPDLRECFGHLSPTLRLLALGWPKGSSRQIMYFIGLFPNLQDLKLQYPILIKEYENAVDTTLVPPSSPPLQGRLTLVLFTREQIVKDMITLFGGLRFRQMDLFGVKCLPLLLEKCAETLETLRLYPTDPYAKNMCFDLSQNKALRTLETTAQSIVYAKDAGPGFLKTVISSVTSPGMLDVVIIYRDRDLSGWEFCGYCLPNPVCLCGRRYQPSILCLQPQLRVFREMCGTRDFQLVFCVDVYDCLEDIGVRLLESVVKDGWESGGFRYLICRPVVTCERRTIHTRAGDYYIGGSTLLIASAL